MHRKISFFVLFLLAGFFFFIPSSSVSAQSCTGQATGQPGTCMVNTACPNGQHDSDPPVCGAFPNECCITPAGAPVPGAPAPAAGSPAGLNYTLLEQVPGTAGWNLTLPQYLQALYKFTFWAIGIAALLMLSVGGFMYVTSAGNTSRMGTAKDMIRDSIIGIVLAIVAWLFLYVINPDLVQLKLPTITATPPTPAPPSRTGLPPSPPSGVLSDADARARLQAAGITVNATQPQTSLENMPVLALDRLIELQRDSGCGTVVTGGTEGGHQTHGQNKAIVDVRNNACYDAFFIKLGRTTLFSTYNISQLCVTAKNSTIYKPPYGVANCLEGDIPAHYHLSFF